MRLTLSLFYFMAKDPAFLFYSNDFLSGTYTMSDDQVGKFIRLLCLQHQKNYLSEKDMLNICKTQDEDIFCKFIKDDKGFYNQRLRDESEKRKSYSESRKNNRKKKDMKNISETYEQHMENENENINENIIINKANYFKKEEITILPENYIISSIQQIKIQKQKTITVNQVNDLWEVFKSQYLTGEQYYHSENKVYLHFVNWIKNQKFETNGKPTTAEDKFNAYKEYANRYS